MAIHGIDGDGKGGNGISFESLKEDYHKAGKIATQMSQNILNNCGNYLNGSMQPPAGASNQVSTSAAAF